MPPTLDDAHPLSTAIKHANKRSKRSVRETSTALMPGSPSGGISGLAP